MRKFKKITCSILALIFMLCLVQVPVSTNAESSSSDDNVYIKVRYTRADGNYDGWDIWAWNDKAGISGANAFTGKDSKGVYALFKAKKTDGELGLIVRTESWTKCYDGDAMIDLSKGDQEVVFNWEDRNYKIVEPETDFDKVTLNLHYYRFDDTYDNWDVWTWGGDEPGTTATFEDDSFGKVSKMTYENVTSESKVGYIVRLNDWSDREQSNGNDGNRFLRPIAIDADGNADAYVVQGDKDDYYRLTDANLAKEPKIFSAKIDTLKKVTYSASFAVPSESSIKVVDKDNNNVEIESVNLKDSTIIMKNELDFVNNSYTLIITDAYGHEITQNFTLGKIFADDSFADKFTYDGELGALYSSDKTKFVLWSPTATDVKVALYEKDGQQPNSSATRTLDMEKKDKGVWELSVDGNLNGVYYNFIVDGRETVDPYAKAVGVNGDRAMVIDLDETDPAGWNVEKRPELKSATDAVIYEMHIRDFTIGDDSGTALEYKGKFKGVWQPGTTIPGTDIKTGIDHLKELGVNTVQIMPTYDYATVDESKLDTPQFNWGYDPKNYNAIEGSYSSDPYNASIRISEFKELIKALHEAGIRVTMDVVYNHTSAAEGSNLSSAVPNYYYRQTETGGFSNGSGCGNELASERSMVRKLIVDSVVYLATEYHLDGFRFDLMACLDKDTVIAIREALDKIDPSLTFIAEGWTGGTSSLDPELQSTKANTAKNYGNKQIAMFSDDMRDGIKGHVFTATAPAFINGGEGFEERIKFGIVAATANEQVNYVNDGNKVEAWASQPTQCVNYASCHDNNTLYDRLQLTNPDATKEELVAMNKVSATLIFTSQGIPFLLSGEEFARTKVDADGTLVENSYNASDAVNGIGWSRKKEYSDLYEYYKGLIQLRAKHKVFRMNTTEQIQKNLKFIDVEDKNVVAYTLTNEGIEDNWKSVVVAFNANKEAVDITIPSNDYVVVVNGEKAGTTSLGTVSGDKLTIPGKASYVLVDKASFEKGPEGPKPPTDSDNVDDTKTDNGAKDKNLAKTASNKKTGDSTNMALVVAIVSLAVVVTGTIVVINNKKKGVIEK